MISSSYRSIAAICASLTLIATGCTATPGDQTNTLTIAMPAMESQQPDSLADPAYFYGGPGITLTNAVYDGLLRYKPDSADSAIEGALAESWEVSPDGLRYTLTLREAKFASGATVTAGDVKFSFDRLIKLKTATAYMLDGVTAVEATDDRTVVLTLAQPNSSLLAYLASPYGPKVLEEAVVTTNDDGDSARRWLSTHSAGSGPFALSAWEPNQSYTLKANEHYWGGYVPTQTVVIRATNDTASQLIGLRNGTIDVARIDQPADLQQVESSMNALVAPSLLMQVLAVNPTLAPFDQPQLRQALSTALDTTALTQRIWGGLGEPATQLLPPGLLPALADTEPAYEGPERLAAEVAKLQPEQRNVTLYYTTQSADERMAQAVAEVLQTAGLNVTLRQPSNGVEWWKTDQVHLYIQTTNPDAATPDAWVQIFYKTTGFLNYLHGGLPEVDELIDAARTATDPAEAEQMYRTLMRLMKEHSTFVSIASVKNAFGVNRAVKGLTTTPSSAFAVGLATVSK